MADKIVYGKSELSVLTQKFDSKLEKLLETEEAEYVRALYKNDADDAELFEKNKQAWYESHKDEIDERILAKKSVVAAVKHKEIKEIIMLMNNSEVIKNLGRLNDRISDKYRPVETNKIYGEIGKKAFDNIFELGKVQNKMLVENTPAIIKYQRLEFGVRQNTEEIIQGIKNAEKKGKFVAFDTETFGGINKFGQQNFDRLTEFSFGIYDYKTGELLKTSDGKEKFFGSIIGISPKDVEKYQDIITRTENNLPLTGEEQVIYHRLSLMGKSVVTEDDGSGIFQYKHFADKNEIKTFDKQNARKGLEQLKFIGERQIAVGENIFYGGEKMYAWEKTFFEGLDAIFNDGLTAVGYNIEAFDNVVIRNQLRHGMKSEGAKNYAKKILEKFPTAAPKYQVDMLAVLRQYSPDRLEILRDAEGNINAETLKFVKENNLTLRQQETLEHALKISAENSAHTSKEDSRVAAKLFTHDIMKLDSGEASVLNNKNFSAPIEIKGDKTQLFYATSGTSPTNYNLLGFFTDPLSGELRTADGYIIGEKKLVDGTVEEIGHQNFFSPGAIKKGVSYTIDDVTGVKTSDEFQKLIKKYYPSLDSPELTAVKFTPQTLSDSLKAKISYVAVGTKSDIQNFINHSFIYTAKREKTDKGTFGAWQEDISESDKKLMTKIGYKDGGKKFAHITFSLEDQLEESTRTITESSNRLNREKSAAKDLGALRFLSAQNKFVENYNSLSDELKITPKQNQEIENLKNKIASLYDEYGKAVTKTENFFDSKLDDKLFTELVSIMNFETDSITNKSKRDKFISTVSKQKFKLINNFVHKEIIPELLKSRKENISEINEALKLLREENKFVEKKLKSSKANHIKYEQRKFLQAHADDKIFSETVDDLKQKIKVGKKNELTAETVSKDFLQTKILERNVFEDKLRANIEKKFLNENKKQLRKIQTNIDFFEKFLNPNDKKSIDHLDTLKKQYKDLLNAPIKERASEIITQNSQVQEMNRVIDLLKKYNELFNTDLGLKKRNAAANRAHKKFAEAHSDNKFFVDFIEKENRFLNLDAVKNHDGVTDWSIRELYRKILNAADNLEDAKNNFAARLNKEEIFDLTSETAKSQWFKEINSTVDDFKKYHESLAEEEKIADKISELENKLFYLTAPKTSTGGTAKSFEISVMNRTENLIEKINSEKTLPKDELKNSFLDFFGYEDSETKKPKVFMETVANQLSRLNYVEQNKNLITRALILAHKKVGIDIDEEILLKAPIDREKKAEIQYFYELIMQTYENASIKKFGNRSALGEVLSTSRLYELGKFDFNLAGFQGIKDIDPEKTVITINKNESGKSIVKKIYKLRTGKSIENLSSQAQVAELDAFQRFLIKSKPFKKHNDLMGKFYGKMDKDKKIIEGTDRIHADIDDVDSAGAKITSLLNEIYKVDPAFGRTRETKTYDAEKIQKSFGLTEKEIQELEEGEIKNLLEQKVEFFNHRIESKEQLKERARRKAAKIVDDVLYNIGLTDEELKTDLIDNHKYTERQAEKLISMKNIRKADTQLFMEKLLENLMNHGADIIISPDTRQLALKYGNDERILDSLPRAIYENGGLFTQIKNQKLILETGFYEVDSYGKDYGTLTYASKIKKAADDVMGWIPTVLERADEEGTLLDKTESIISSLNSRLRESPAFQIADRQELRSQFVFNYRDVYKFINKYRDEIVENLNLDKESAEGYINSILAEFSEKVQKSDYVDFYSDSGIQAKAEKIISVMAEHLDSKGKKAAEKILFDEVDGEKILNVSMLTKHSGEGKGTVETLSDFAEETANTKRGTGNFLARSLKFKTQEIGEDVDIQFDKGISTEFAGHYETDAGKGVSAEVSTTARINRMRISNFSLRELINNYDGFSDEKIRDFLTHIHLEEGSAVVDPFLTNTIFRERISFQKINLKTVLDFDGRNIEDLDKKINMMPLIDIDDKGKVNFKYNSGEFFETGELILRKNGTQGISTSVEAKEAGVFNIGFWNKSGVFAEEEDIQKLLDSSESVSRLQKAETEEAKRLEVFKILDEVYEAKYYSQPLSSRTAVKLAEFAEKGEYFNLAVPVGTLDKRVEQAFKNLGLWKTFENEVPGYEYVKSLSEDNLSKTPLGKLIAKKTGGEIVSDEKIRLAISDAGFKDAKDFRQAVETEQRAAYNQLMKIFEQAGLKKTNEYIGVVSNTAAAEIKHLDPFAAVNRVADNLLVKYNNDVQKVFDIMQSAVDGLEIKNNRLTANQEDIHFQKLNEIAQREFVGEYSPERIFRQDSNGNFISQKDYENLSDDEKLKFSKKYVADVAQVEIRHLPNLDRSNFENDGFKIDQRGLTMLESHKFDENVLNTIKKSFVNSFGETEGQKRMNYFLGDVKAGSNVNQFFSDLVKARTKNLSGKNEIKILGGTDEERQLAYKELENIGISYDASKKIVDANIRDGVTKMTHGAVKNEYQVAAYQTAAKFNQGEYNLSSIKNTPFADTTPINIQQLDTTAMSDLRNQKNFNSVFGRNQILDLHLGFLGDNQLYTKDSERYIALPWTDFAYMNDYTVSKNPWQQKVAQLQRTISNFEKEHGATASDSDRENFITHTKVLIDDIKNTIGGDLIKKHGVMAQANTAIFPDSGSFKAYGMHLYGDEKGHWKNLSFEGINILEEARKGSKGLHLDYQIIGTSVFKKKFLNDEYFKSLGLDEELTQQIKNATYQNLKTSGTISEAGRYPHGYPNSLTPSITFISDFLTGDMAQIDAVSFEKRKGDYDSDNLNIHIFKGDAEIIDVQGNKKSVSIDYSTYQALLSAKQSGAVKDIFLSDEAKKTFGGAKESLIYNAAYVNPKYVEKMKYDSPEVVGSYNFDHLKSLTVDGILTEGGLRDPKMRMEYGDGQIFRGYYNQTRNSYSEGTEAFDALSSEEKQAAYLDFANKNLGTQGRAKAINALKFQYAVERHRQDTIANVRKAHAGEINNLVFNYFRVAQMGGEAFSGSELNALAHVHSALNEAFLSPKNESGVEGLELAKNLREAFNRGYREVMQWENPSEEKIKEVRAQIESIVKPVLENRAGKEIAMIPGVNLNEGKASAEDIDKLTSLFSSVIQRVTASGVDLNTMNVGITTKGNKELLTAYPRAFHKNFFS